MDCQLELTSEAEIFSTYKSHPDEHTDNQNPHPNLKYHILIKSDNIIAVSEYFSGLLRYALKVFYCRYNRIYDK